MMYVLAVLNAPCWTCHFLRGEEVVDDGSGQHGKETSGVTYALSQGEVTL